LAETFGFSPQDTVADIAAGTGISSRLFLVKNYTVIAVEPNASMRNAAISQLQHFSGFRMSSGTAEKTLLPDRAVDVVVAAQAFHWFNTSAVRDEFRRILKPGGWVVLIWNERRIIQAGILTTELPTKNLTLKLPLSCPMKHEPPACV